MAKAIVRAIGVFGKWHTRYEDDFRSLPDADKINDSYVSIRKFLEENGQKGFPPFNIMGCGNPQSYLINNTLVTNVLYLGNGFNFEGDVQTLVGLGFDERAVQETLKRLTSEGVGILFDYWKENPKFTKNVNIPRRLGKDISRLLAEKPESLVIR